MTLADRNKLVTENLKLARWAVMKWGQGLDYDDAYQEACLALMSAAEKHDPTKGTFATYARHWMWRNIYEARRHTSIVHVPPKLWANCKVVRCRLPVSVHDDGRVEDRLVDPRKPLTVEVSLARAKIARLPARLQDVLQRRLAGERMCDVATTMGVSKQYVDQLQRSAVQALNGDSRALRVVA